MNYESKNEPMVSNRAFTHRMLRHFCLSSLVIGVALGVGVAGYHIFAGFSWMDSLLNASMILGGMGPVGELPGDGAKVFASLYALFSGLVFIGASAILFAPVAHRVLHAFHIDDSDQAP
ncbi:MAG: hypothetical protein K1X78_08445 [Verrucomicrobiaceae bacterium]|nr:hypothetical protein [Verrucomicrobiaceae bacterium]